MVRKQGGLICSCKAGENLVDKCITRCNGNTARDCA